jgi:hypothetical protein
MTLPQQLEKFLEFELCEISKTNNQYKHGRRAENKRLSPVLKELVALVKAVEEWTKIGYKNPNDAEIAICEALAALKRRLDEVGG